MSAPRVRPSATNEVPVPGGPSSKARNLVGLLISQKSSRSTGELSRMNATRGAESSGVVATWIRKMKTSSDWFFHLDIGCLCIPGNLFGEQVVLPPF